MNIEKRRAEIAARKAEIRKLIEGDTENKLNMDDLEKELRELNEEDEKLEKRQAIERMLNGGAAPASPAGLSNPAARSANQPAPESTEKLYRSAWLKTLQGKPLTDDEKRAYSTAANSGLPIIPETTANQIIKKMYEVAPILQRCKIFHVPGNFKFAIEGTNDEAALHTENAAITAASDSLGSVSLTGYEIVKLVKASRACSEMALSAFESYIVEVIAEAVARRIEKYIFTGTGTNQPGGVKTAGKGASGAYTDGTDQINLVEFTRALMEKYNIPAENVVRHYDVTGKWCPRPWMGDDMNAYYGTSGNEQWARFKARLSGNEEVFDMDINEARKQLTSCADTGDTPSAWAKEAAEYCKRKGIFNGDGAGNFGWQQPITREAVACIIYRTLEAAGALGNLSDV